MSRQIRTDEARDRARRAAAHVRQAAAKVKPIAGSTEAAAKRRVRTARAWAAPRVEHTGQVLQDSVAPKVAAALSSAARRLEPAKPQHRPWRTLLGVAAVTAAASAAAAWIRNRRKPDSTTPAAKADDAGAAETGDGQASPGTGTGTGANAGSQIRTS